MAAAAKHRHVAEGGYARGEETRARIVAAALKLFGERGFEGASTRDIATAAGVNAPALQYYFDNKEGVYLACVEHIVACLSEYLTEVTERGEQALARNAGDEELIETFCAIQARLAEFMFAVKDAADWRLFIARLQSGEGPPASFEIFQQGRLKKRLSGVTSTIVGRLLGSAPDDEETLIRTMTLTGQLTVFQFAPRSFLARLNWDALDADRLARLKSVVREQTTALLRWMVASRDMQGGDRRRTVRSTPRPRRR
jgi:TetR/AcrR family transcriptional regulator, regulator of cefoperazone and chloramphenicol sensitivity